MIDVAALTSFETADDGASILMHMRDATGGAVTMSLPVACLNSLMMTLPKMLVSAIQRRHNDASLRIVYPADRLTMELDADRRTRIMTVATPDGFEVSFGLSGAQCREIAACEAQSADVRAQVPLFN